MIFAVIGIILGVCVGIFLPWAVTPSSTVYVAAAILAALDSVFGGMNAFFKKSFNMAIFVSGLVCNALLAVVIILLGEKIGIDLYIAVIVIFGTRIFNNFASVRHHIIMEYTKKRENADLFKEVQENILESFDENKANSEEKNTEKEEN